MLILQSLHFHIYNVNLPNALRHNYSKQTNCRNFHVWSSHRQHAARLFHQTMRMVWWNSLAARWTKAIPDVEISAVRLFTIIMSCIRQVATTSVVQEVENQRGWGRWRGLKVVKSCSWGGHFLFTCSGTSAVGCIL